MLAHAERENTHHDVGISVYELYEFFQTPKTAFETAEQKSRKGVLGTYRKEGRAKHDGLVFKT